MDDTMNNDISLKEYLSEKINEIKTSLSDLKADIRNNQNDNISKMIRMEDEINKRIKLIENELNELVLIKKYWRVFAVTLVVFGLITIYSIKNQLFP